MLTEKKRISSKQINWIDKGYHEYIHLKKYSYHQFLTKLKEIIWFIIGKRGQWWPFIRAVFVTIHYQYLRRDTNSWGTNEATSDQLVLQTNLIQVLYQAAKNWEIFKDPIIAMIGCIFVSFHSYRFAFIDALYHFSNFTK